MLHPLTIEQLLPQMRMPTERRRPPFFATKKLAIVGMTNTRYFTPWHDPSWTIAVHPCVYRLCGRDPDWWFDLHPRTCFTKNKSWHPNYLYWLKHLRQPIFMQEDWPDIPMAIRYPQERVMGEYRAYFTNHAAWMIALAMTEGCTHIGLFGCEYAHEQERGHQRGSCEYWLGMFEGAGGHVILPPGCRLLNKPAELYGYESHGDDGRLIPSYLAVPTMKTKQADGKLVQTPLTVIDMNKAEGRPKLMQLPEQEPAWERSGHKIHA